MLVRRLFRTLVLSVVLALVIAACGGTAAPTAAPESPTAVPSNTGAPTPAPAATPVGGDVPAVMAGSGYPPEKAKALLAENMYLPGMSFGQGEAPQLGGTASYSNKAPLPSDDIAEGSITRINVIAAVFGDGDLVKNKRTANGEFDTSLAESWTVSNDFKVWTFKLRPGVKYHDGTPFTAEHVKYEVELQLSPPLGRRTLALFNRLPNLEKVEAVDPLTARMTFKEASPHLLETMVDAATFSHPMHLFKPEIDKGNVTVGPSQVNWVGLGPFKFDSFTRGTNFRVVRFDQFWEKDAAGRSLPYLDVVENFFIPDRAVALGAFRAGRLDSTARGVGSSMDPEMIIAIKRTLGDNGVWFHRYPYNEYGIQFNMMKPPFDDIRARKAVFLYMDRDEGGQKMQGGFAFSSGFLSPASWYHSGAYKDWPGYTRDTKAADQAEGKRLLQEAGVVGAPVSILCRTDYLFMCEFAESVLRGVGFAPFIDLRDVNAQAEMSRTGQFQTQTSGPGALVFPGDQLVSYVTTAAYAGVYRPLDTKIDDFQKIILTSLDPDVRRKALWQAERYYLLEMAYNAPFLREETVQAYRTYLKGSVVPGFQPHSNADRATDWIDKVAKDNFRK